MPYREKEIKKLYYSIGEVADLLQVNASLIRYWESEFAGLSPRKNNKGNRMFTDDDINLLRTIHHLVKEKGYTIEGARNRLRAKPGQDAKRLKAIQGLKEIRSFLIKLQEKTNQSGS
jgi:DNA-binding transcriptional MerR regulator